MVNGEDYVKIMNRQDPFLLRFEPLRFLESPTRGAMPIFSGFIVELPTLTFKADSQNAAHCWRAAIHDGVHDFRLLIRKPMRTLVFSNMFAEDVSHFVFRP